MTEHLWETDSVADKAHRQETEETEDFRAGPVDYAIYRNVEKTKWTNEYW